MARKKKRRGFDIEKMSDLEFRKLISEVAGPRAETSEPEPDPRFTRLLDYPTPLGGDYAIAFFYDSEHNPCREEDAKYVNTVMLSAKSSWILVSSA